jgi:hypothetical protein
MSDKEQFAGIGILILIAYLFFLLIIDLQKERNDLLACYQIDGATVEDCAELLK